MCIYLNSLATFMIIKDPTVPPLCIFSFIIYGFGVLMK